MSVSQASKIWLEYHRAHSKHNTIKGGRPAKRICSCPENCSKADDFPDLLWSSQGNGWKSRQIGWNTIEATRSATSCGNIRIPFKCSFRDNFKDNFTTYRALKLPKFIWERSVIPKLSDGLKTFMHKKHWGES